MEKLTRYQEINIQLGGLLKEANHDLSRYTNYLALLYQNFPLFSWVGIYFKVGEQLILGPFQGRVACDTIALGRGVCGSVALSGKAHLAADVSLLDNYIACDAKTAAEIVLPIIVNNQIIGVLDVDSYVLGAFDHDDELGLQITLNTLIAHLQGDLQL